VRRRRAVVDSRREPRCQTARAVLRQLGAGSWQGCACCQGGGRALYNRSQRRQHPPRHRALRMKLAYCVVTWSGAVLAECLHTIPKGSRLLVVDTSQHAWSLAKAWNYAIDRLLVREGFTHVVIGNDDILLKPETGPLLVEGLDSRPDLLMVTGYNTRDREDVGPRWEEGGCDFSCFCVDHRLRDA